MHYHPGPTEYAIFAAIMAVFFYFGLRRKPPPHEDDRWVWWVAMLSLGAVILYCAYRGLQGYQIIE